MRASRVQPPRDRSWRFVLFAPVIAVRVPDYKPVHERAGADEAKQQTRINFVPAIAQLSTCDPISIRPMQSVGLVRSRRSFRDSSHIADIPSSMRAFRAGCDKWLARIEDGSPRIPALAVPEFGPYGAWKQDFIAPEENCQASGSTLSNNLNAMRGNPPQNLHRLCFNIATFAVSGGQSRDARLSRRAA